MSELKLCIFNRTFERKKITEIHNSLQSNLETLTKTDKLVRLAKLKLISEEIKSLNQRVLSLLFDVADETKLNNELTDCDSYEQKLIECSVLLQDSIESADDVDPVNVHSDCSTRLKPPIAPLPSYSGAVSESLDRFINSFEAVVSKYSYSRYEKFKLLKKQISGRALTLVDSLESDKQSYEKQFCF